MSLDNLLKKLIYHIKMLEQCSKNLYFGSTENNSIQESKSTSAPNLPPSVFNKSGKNLQEPLYRIEWLELCHESGWFLLLFVLTVALQLKRIQTIKQQRGCA